MRFLDINEVTARVALTIGTSTPQDRLIFRTWVVDALRDIGPDSAWVKVCTLYPQNRTFRKPEDITSIIDIALYDSSGTELVYNFNTASTRIHTDRNTLYNEDNIQVLSTRLDLSEDAYYLHMSSNGDGVAYAFIRYFAMPVDRDGMPLVREDNMIAFITYCRWMWAMRKNDNRSEIAQNYDMWLRERDRVKGRNKMPSMVESKQIMASWMNLLTNPTFNTF